MGLKELKEEANKLGYTLTKKIVYEKVKVCPICKKRPIPEITVSPTGKFYRCPRCRLAGDIHRATYKAISSWNRMVEEYER